MQFGVNKAAKMSPTRKETGKGGENICEKSKVVVSRKRPKPGERPGKKNPFQKGPHYPQKTSPRTQAQKSLQV